jgi:signal transduction histidine kinase
VLAGSFLAIVLWIVHRLRLRILTDRVRNLLAERLSERERVARELNDTLLQGMQGLILLFQGIAVQIPPESPLASKLEIAISHAEQLMIEGRDSVRDLGSSSVDLADALRSLNAEQRQPETGYSVEVTGRERDLQFLVSDEVFQIAREAIVNAFRHASAEHVWVTLTYRRASLDLSVVDDGRGISKSSTEKSNSGQWGLVKMRDRARKLKGRLQILSQVPSGTAVRLSVPATVAYRVGAFFDAAWLRTAGDFFGRGDSKQ